MRRAALEVNTSADERRCQAGSDLRHRASALEKGKPANFFVYYEFDEDESKHALALEEYGRREAPNAWVLLEEL